MAGELWGRASYPGIQSIVGATYTATHGISPSVCIIKAHPQNPALIAQTGNVVLTDGRRSVVLRQCKFDKFVYQKDSTGEYLYIHLLDRRWIWRDFQSISGCYNQVDPHGKLIPWMIRSPTELAYLCLVAMGELHHFIDLPPGLPSSVGQNLSAFLQAGQVFPQLGINPPVNWVNVRPAQALQQLVEPLGRRVVLDPITNAVGIVRNGHGAALPPGSIRSISPTIDLPEIPSVAAIQGAPTRYQARFELWALGEDWDGSYRPINTLSYAPVLDAQVQIVKVSGEWTPPAIGTTVRVGIKVEGMTDYVYFEVEIGAQTPNQVFTAMAAKINASAVPAIKEIKAGVAGSELTLTGKNPKVQFDVDVRFSGAQFNGAKLEQQFVQSAREKGPGWDYSPPPFFPGIREVPGRLTLAQARALAQKSVWKYFGLSGRDVSKKGAIFIPGYGRLKRKQQVLLQDTKVDQIVPRPIDRQFKDRLGNPIYIHHYNGYSRDVPAEVYGSVARYLIDALVIDPDAGVNTPEFSKVFIDFSVDPTYQMIRFSSPCYKIGKGGRIVEPELVLETACNIRHQDSNAMEAYTLAVQLRAGGVTAMFTKEDVQLNITATYNDKGVVTSTSLLEFDPVRRANYYLTAAVLQYYTKDSSQVEYNGIMPIGLDGAIQQVTWEVGDGNDAKTTASRNCESPLFVMPYPERRRRENLRPAETERVLKAADPPRINPAEPDGRQRV